MPLPQEKERYTYRDYCQWSDDERWELLDGVAYSMSPAPSFRHQRVLVQLVSILNNALKGKSCIPMAAPLDVVLSDWDVVQPDVLIICDHKKITEKNIQGAPDVIFEILSPSTSRKDRWEKRALYEKFGVKEYVILDPEGNYVERFLLEEDGRFNRGEVFGENDILVLKTIPVLEIPLSEVLVMDVLIGSD